MQSIIEPTRKSEPRVRQSIFGLAKGTPLEACAPSYVLVVIRRLNCLPETTTTLGRCACQTLPCVASAMIFKIVELQPIRSLVNLKGETVVA